MRVWAGKRVPACHSYRSANHLPPGVRVIMYSENGLRLVAMPDDGDLDKLHACTGAPFTDGR